MKMSLQQKFYSQVELMKFRFEILAKKLNYHARKSHLLSHGLLARSWVCFVQWEVILKRTQITDADNFYLHTTLSVLCYQWVAFIIFDCFVSGWGFQWVTTTSMCLGYKALILTAKHFSFNSRVDWTAQNLLPEPALKCKVWKQWQTQIKKSNTLKLVLIIWVLSSRYSRQDSISSLV